MTRYLTFLIAGALGVSTNSFANENVEIKANILNSSCEISLENNGTVELGTVNGSYFVNQGTPDDMQSGGRAFYITLKSCYMVGSTTPNKVTFHFTPLSGNTSRYSNQIFANETASGPQNVGVVILSTYDVQNIFNVLNTDGTPRSIYDVTATEYEDTRYPFYARMQKIVPGQSITSGAVSARVLVAVTYE